MHLKATKILLIAESVFAFGSGLFLPIFAIFSEQVGGDILDAGIAAAIFIFVTAILEVPVGILLDKYSKKNFLVLDYFLEAFVFLGYIFINTTTQLFLLQIIAGIAAALGDPAWESMYDDGIKKNETGKSWASYHLYSGIATSVALVFGSFLVETYGFPLLFLIGAIFSTSAGVIAMKYLKE